MNYRRKEYYLLEERMRPNGPNRIQMVVGPRQVGKTTLVLQWLRTVQEPNNLRYFTGDAQIGSSWIEGAAGLKALGMPHASPVGPIKPHSTSFWMKSKKQLVGVKLSNACGTKTAHKE